MYTSYPHIGTGPQIYMKETMFYVFLAFSVILDAHNGKNEWIFNTWSMFSKACLIPVCDKSLDKTPLSSLLSADMEAFYIFNLKNKNIVTNIEIHSSVEVQKNYISHIYIIVGNPRLIALRSSLHDRGSIRTNFLVFMHNSWAYFIGFLTIIFNYLNQSERTYYHLFGLM